MLAYIGSALDWCDWTDGLFEAVDRPVQPPIVVVPPAAKSQLDKLSGGAGLS